MAKLTVCAVTRRQGRPRGTVLAILDDHAEFGRKETLANGVLRVSVPSKRTERELAKLLSYREYEQDRPRASDGTQELRSRRLGDDLMDTLEARAKEAFDETATCTVREIVDGRETRSIAGVEREGIRRDAQVRAWQP